MRRGKRRFYNIIGHIVQVQYAIRGQGAVGQGGNRYARGHSDTESMPPADPVFYIVPCTYIMHPAALRNASDPADFDIHNIGRVQLPAAFGVMQIMNAFIQTDRGLDLLLQFGMIDQIVIHQRLFNHGQIHLVNLPEKARQLIADSGTGYTPAELGLRWLWDQPGILTVLSGMNSSEMVEENIRIASEMNVGMMSESDQTLVAGVRDIIREQEKVGCTACRYCMPCPQGVDIPGIFHYWNLMYIEGKKFDARFEFARNIGLRHEPGFASQCVGCGACEQHCPQHLPITQLLKQADKELRPLPYRAGLSIARKFLGR